MATHNLTSTTNHNYTQSALTISLFSRFINWCSAQQKDRMLWQSLILGLHGCIITPIAMLIALKGGAEHFYYIPVIIAIAINLVPNLAALSTRITIPVFFMSILIDLLVILAVLL